MAKADTSRARGDIPAPARDGGTAGGTTREHAATGAGQPEVPAGPMKLSRRAWVAAVKRTVREFSNDFLQDRAAALTYYGIMSIFPALLVVVSLLGLLHQSPTLITNLTKGFPPTAQKIITNAVNHLQGGHATAGIVAIVSIALGLWSASGYVAAFMRASNAIYDVPEGRPFWKTYPTRLGITLAVLLLLVLSAVIVVVTGGIAQRVGNLIHAGHALILVWNIAKWPVLLILVSAMFAILYWGSPNARQKIRWVTPGGILAVIVWLAASGLFALYVANFGHYNKVYGSLAGVIIFLLWMWISNTAILLGAELNAELQRGRAIAAGAPPDAEPFAEMRDTRKLRKKRKRRRPAG